MVRSWCSLKCLYTLLLLFVVSVDWSVGRPPSVNSVILEIDEEEGGSEVTSNIVDNRHPTVPLPVAVPIAITTHSSSSSDSNNFEKVGQKNDNQQQQLLLDQDSLLEFNEELRQKLLEQLGFQQTIHISTYTQEANISKTEYLRAYTEYMSNVRERRRRERAEGSSHPKVRRSQAEIFVQRYNNGAAATAVATVAEPTEMMMTNGNGNVTTGVISLKFPVQTHQLLPRDQVSRYRLQVRQASLFLPEGCSPFAAPSSSSSSNWSEVDLTRTVSRWMDKNNLKNNDDISMPLELSVSCNITDTDAASGSSLRIVWMKTRMGGGGGQVEEKRRVRRSLKNNNMDRVGGGGGNGGGHNRRHRLSDFVAADPGNFEDKRIGGGGGSGNGGGKKRGADCGQLKHGKSCCRKPLTVSFEDLKITDVILAPIRFNMDYCEGRCNAKRLPYASTHAMFQHIINRSKSKDLQAPKLCCTPTKLSELDVIQVDPDSPNSLKVTVIHNAKVEECGCS